MESKQRLQFEKEQLPTVYEQTPMAMFGERPNFSYDEKPILHRSVSSSMTAASTKIRPTGHVYNETSVYRVDALSSRGPTLAVRVDCPQRTQIDILRQSPWPCTCHNESGVPNRKRNCRRSRKKRRINRKHTRRCMRYFPHGIQHVQRSAFLVYRLTVYVLAILTLPNTILERTHMNIALVLSIGMQPGDTRIHATRRPHIHTVQTTHVTRHATST